MARSLAHSPRRSEGHARTLLSVRLHPQEQRAYPRGDDFEALRKQVDLEAGDEAEGILKRSL
jgi:hypothetical protein